MFYASSVCVVFHNKNRRFLFWNALISYPSMDNYVHLGTNDCQGDVQILYEKFIHSSTCWHLYHWLIDILAIEQVYLIRLPASML